MKEQSRKIQYIECIIIQISIVLSTITNNNLNKNRMLGHLQPNSIALLNPHLFVAFGCQFYVFNTTSQQCLKNIDLGHQTEIVCAHFNVQKKGYKLVSLDSSGMLATADLVFEAANNQESSKDFRINNIKKYSLSNKNGKLVISKAIFISNTTILYLDKNHKLYIIHLDSPTQPQPISPNQVYSSIFTSSSYTFLIHQQNEKKLTIFINKSQKVMKEYIHSCRITSVTNVENTLVIGDQRGKITLEYLYLDQLKNGKNKAYSSVLEWHTGPVLSLCSYGRYLYSAGHESVVVLWHTRDLSRDFLPRVGTAIHHISINPQTNQIICVLSDNSVKIIDLSKDKQTLTFKTILDPKGYSPEQGPRFSPSTCAYHNGILCMNSVPGKVQFINLHKNIENRQLEIVPRNLVNGINNDKLAPHRITSFVFSSDWAYSCYIIRGESRSYMKFYRRSIQGYDAINRIESPHIGHTKKCVSLQKKNNVYFVTFSQEDEILRVWTEHSQKKKSILDVSQVYWKCSQEIGFRGLKPTSIDARAGLLLVVYAQHQIVIYELDSQGILTILNQTLVCQNIKQSRILSPQIQNPTTLKLLTQSSNNSIQIWNWQSIKPQPQPKLLPQLTIQQKLTPKQQTISEYIIIGHKQSAVVLNYQKELNQIIIIDNKTGKFIQLYSSDSNIQTLFWHCDRAVVVGQDFMICGLDGGELVRFVGEGVGDMVGEEVETDVFVNFGETNIFKINEKWVERQTLKNKNKVSDCTQSLSLLPSCVSMWQQMSAKLLL